MAAWVDQSDVRLERLSRTAWSSTSISVASASAPTSACSEGSTTTSSRSVLACTAAAASWVGATFSGLRSTTVAGFFLRAGDELKSTALGFSFFPFPPCRFGGPIMPLTNPFAEAGTGDATGTDTFDVLCRLGRRGCLFEAEDVGIGSTRRSADRCMSSLEGLPWLPIDEVIIGIIRCLHCPAPVSLGVLCVVTVFGVWTSLGRVGGCSSTAIVTIVASPAVFTASTGEEITMAADALDLHSSCTCACFGVL